ncbi:hypothetical protein HYU20_04175, partial [Candidatus Woesearchaeota archaeon]|nr:hypothetical protein [Candidatus Woesearchaeota archaeon]
MPVGEESPVAKLARPATAVLLAAMIVALAALQLHTIPTAKECLLEKATGHSGFGALLGCFGANTIWPMLLLFQAALFLIIVEVFYGSASELFETVFASNRKTLFLVAAAAAVLTLFYIAPGDVLLGDAYLFQPAAQIFKDAATQGIPHHTFYWYGGSAHFEYYGQLYFAIAAAADVVLSDMNLTLKIVNWLLHIAAAVAVYLLALELTKSRKVSFVAAIAYSVSYEHIARIMLHGRIMNSLTYFLLPLLLLIFEKHIKGKISKVAAVAGLSLTAAAIFLNNPGDGTFLLVAAAVYSAIRFLQLAQPQKKTAMLTAAITAAFFILLTSFWTLPFVLERAAVNAGARVGELTSISFRPEILKDIVSFPGQKGIAMVYYLGIVQIALAAIAAILIIKRKRNQALTAVAIAAAITLFLMLMQSPRYAPAFVLALAVLAGVGSVYAAQILAAKARSAKLLRFVTAEQIFLLLAALIVLDSAAAIMQPYYPDFSAEKKILADRIPTEAGFRTVDLHSDRRTFYPSLTYLATKTESLFGSLLEGAPKSTNYAIAIATRAAKEHYDDGKGFSNQTLDGLYLFNVKYAVLHPEQKQMGNKGRNFRAAVGLEKQMAVVELENSPVIAAKKVREYRNDELEREENYFLREKFERREVNYGITDEIARLMKINRGKATAEAILVKEAAADGETAGGNEIEIKVVAVETKHSRVKLSVEQSSDAFLQLSYSASPEISVIVDGKETSHYTTAINTIAVKTSKGKHTIEIVASPSKLRRSLFVIAAA